MSFPMLRPHSKDVLINVMYFSNIKSYRSQRTIDRTQRGRHRSQRNADKQLHHLS